MIVLENDYVLEPDPEDVLEAEKDMDEPEERSPVHDEFHISDDDDIHARVGVLCRLYIFILFKIRQGYFSGQDLPIETLFLFFINIFYLAVLLKFLTLFDALI